jgi:hypothetical protein
VTLTDEPSLVDTPTSVCEHPSDLSSDDLEMLKELEESIQASGMDSQDPPANPNEFFFCISCRRCIICRRCTNCNWT